MIFGVARLGLARLGLVWSGMERRGKDSRVCVFAGAGFFLVPPETDGTRKSGLFLFSAFALIFRRRPLRPRRKGFLAVLRVRLLDAAGRVLVHFFLCHE